MTNETCENKSIGLNNIDKIALSSWFGIAGLAAITGNAVVVWLIAKNASLRTVSNIFITSLAVADFFVGLVIAPVWISRCLYSDQYEHKFALAIDYLWIHTTVATTFNLSCITLERNIAIFHPLRYQEILTEKRCFAAIATIWFMSLALPFSRFFINGDSSAIMALWMTFTVITVLIPMIIIALSSVRILRAAAHQSKRVVPSSNLPKQDEIKRNKKNYKAAKTVSIVVGLFVVSWLPSLVTSFVNYFTQSGYCGLLYYYNTVWLWVEAVAFTSSGINPWVYCLRNRLYYQALNRSFRSRLNRASSFNS